MDIESRSDRFMTPLSQSRRREPEPAFVDGSNRSDDIQLLKAHR